MGWGPQQFRGDKRPLPYGLNGTIATEARPSMRQGTQLLQRHRGPALMRQGHWESHSKEVCVFALETMHTQVVG